jgi:HSP20 family molecular chaperone IbpA
VTHPQPELGSVHLREAPTELVLAVSVPDEIDLSRISARLGSGVLEIRLPRVQPARAKLVGFHPDASGV